LTCRPTSLRIFIGVVLLVFLLTGSLACEKQAEAVTMTMVTVTEPSSSVVTRYFEALQRNDYTAANACLDGGTMNVFAIPAATGSSLDVFYGQLMRRLKFAVSADNLQIKAASTATPTVRVSDASSDNISVVVTAMNVPVLFDEAMDQLSEKYAESLANSMPIPNEILESRLYDLLAEAMSADNAPSLSGTLLIHVVQSGGEWRIIANTALYNAVTGNFLQIVNKVPDWAP
jgi:hypothetical protein